MCLGGSPWLKYPVIGPVFDQTPKYCDTGPQMNRRFSPTLFTLILGMIILPSVQCVASGGSCNSIPVPSGTTSCFYIAANGVDTNNGTSESAPWLHAPGMKGCSGTCSSTTPTAGEGFILRGGDT